MKNNQEPKALLMHDRATDPGYGTDFFKDWKNPSEVAQLLKVDIRTIYRWRKEKKLPCAKIGGIYYFPMDAIMILMHKRAQNSLRHAFADE